MSAVARFITIEGSEGVGKSTQVSLLAQTLSARGIDAIVTREPGGTPLAEKIRELVLTAGDEVLPSAAELLLMFAARALHLANTIEPNLKLGRWVICDRFTDATYAYQGAGRGQPTASIAWLETMVQGDRRPDLTLLLDVPVKTALERARQRDSGNSQDRFEREHREFFERVRASYLARAAAEPQRIVILDAAAPAPEVSSRIREVLESRSWMY